MSTPDLVGNPAQTRNVTRLNQKLDRKLAAYVAVAGAAGVGMLALAPPAKGEIVATSTHIVVSGPGTGLIDLNGDGTTDLTICWCFGVSHSAGLLVSAPVGDGWLANNAGLTTYFGRTQAQPLFFGVPIGPGERFNGGYALMARIFGNSISILGSSGNWLGETNRYVGVKFQINDQPHFGWVRITVVNPTGTKGDVTATITGYAYETVPNRNIKAGHTSGPLKKTSAVEQLAPMRMPASLGLLARGADTIAIWRRDEEMKA